jgi:hypothetical protein
MEKRNVAVDKVETVLLLRESDREIIPLSTFAFTAGQFLDEKGLNSTYGGNKVVFRNGDVFLIEKITVVGVAGNSFLSKALNFMSKTRAINVSLLKLTDLLWIEMRDEIINLVRADRLRTTPWLGTEKELEKVVASLAASHSMNEIFEILELPVPEDCLDLLC